MPTHELRDFRNQRRQLQARPLSLPGDTLPGMVAPYFNPHSIAPRPCWHCRGFGGLVYAGSAAACTRRGAPPVRASPATGCAYWQREAGADDEPGPPAPLPAERAEAIITGLRHRARPA